MLIQTSGLYLWCRNICSCYLETLHRYWDTMTVLPRTSTLWSDLSGRAVTPFKPLLPLCSVMIIVGSWNNQSLLLYSFVVSVVFVVFVILCRLWWRCFCDVSQTCWRCILRRVGFCRSVSRWSQKNRRRLFRSRTPKVCHSALLLMFDPLWFLHLFNYTVLHFIQVETAKDYVVMLRHDKTLIFRILR